MVAISYHVIGMLYPWHPNRETIIMATPRTVHLKQNAIALVIWTVAMLILASVAKPHLQEFYNSMLPMVL